MVATPGMTAPVMSAPRYDHPWCRLDRVNIMGEREEGRREGGRQLG